MDESFLLRVLRDIVNRHILICAENSEQEETQATLDPDDLEQRMESLWDLCVDPGTAAFVVANRGITVLGEATGQSRGEGRLAEICLGTLANLSTHHAVVQALSDSDLAALCAAAVYALESRDGLVVLQALRVACALLCGPVARRCRGCWDEASVSCYIYALEHSLRWEVVQYSSDALSQGLVLEAENATASAESEALPSMLPFIAGSKLPGVLAGRIAEIADAVAGEVSSADGDPEAALLSALCLTESLLDVASPTCIAPTDIVPLGEATLKAVAHADRPEVVAAALRVLGALQEAALSSGAATAEDEDTSMAKLATRVRTFAVGTVGLAEKIAMLLREEDGGDAGVLVAALWLLQHLPPEEVSQHRDVLAPAVGEISATEDGRRALQGVSQGFLELLKGTPGDELQ